MVASRKYRCIAPAHMSLFIRHLPLDTILYQIGPYLTIPDRKSLSLTCTYLGRKAAKWKRCHLTQVAPKPHTVLHASEVIYKCMDDSDYVQLIRYLWHSGICFESILAKIPRIILQYLMNDYFAEILIGAGMCLGPLTHFVDMRRGDNGVWMDLFDAAIRRNGGRWVDPLFYGSKTCRVWFGVFTRAFLTTPHIFDTLWWLQQHLRDPEIPALRDVVFQEIQTLERGPEMSPDLHMHFVWVADELGTTIHRADAKAIQ